EGELIAGYHTEYSAMKFSMFYIAEYSNMVTASALMTTLFFGGWDIPFTTWDNTAPWTLLKTLATVTMFGAKVGFFLFLYIWVRWTLPRFRYDQLMALGWKVMLPLALVYLSVIASAIWYLHARLGWAYDARFALALAAVNLALALPRVPPHAHRRAGTRQMRGVRPVPADLSRQLHQARARRRRRGPPLPADLRDRRVPLRVLRLLPGGLPRRGDPRRRALRELGVRPRPVRVRLGAPVRPDPPGLDPLGPRRPQGRMTTTIFWAFAAIAVGSALLCVTRRSPIASALWLVLTLFALAALFVLLDAQFIAVLQVLVYAGAIMVLFL